MEQGNVARINIKPEEIMSFWIAPVHADDALKRKLGTECHDLRLDAFKRREVFGLAAAKVYAGNSPVLVPIFVLHEKDILIGIRPEIAAYPSIGIIGHGLCFIRLACRANPDVEHSIKRCQEAHH